MPVYTSIRTLTNTANGVKSITLTAISPDIVKYYAKNEDRKLYLMLTFNLFLTGFLVNTGLVLSIYFIKPIYSIWTHNELVFNRNLFLFLAAGVSFSTFGGSFVNYFFGVNKLKQSTIINVAKVISLFPLAYLMVGKGDICTVGLSVAFSEFISSFVIPVYLMKLDKKYLFDNGRAKLIYFSILPSFIIIALAMFSYFKLLSVPIILIALFLILLIYYFIWKLLDDEVKDRMKYILIKYIKKTN